MKCKTVYGCLTPQLCGHARECIEGPSERAPSETAGPVRVVAAVATCSLPVSRAEVLALLELWEGMALSYRSQKGKAHHWQKAQLLEMCSEGLRRVAGLTELRQPEENAAYQPVGGEASTETKSNERKP